MIQEEHWRHRLMELHATSGLSQAAFAAKIAQDPSYLSRLFYPPGKKGRKNIGLAVMKAAELSFDLPPGWFDFELGSHLPGSYAAIAREPSAGAANRFDDTKPQWPFKLVAARRLQQLTRDLGNTRGAEALRDIDNHLDILVLKWEREASNLKPQKSA